MNSISELRQILGTCKTIAVVGLSPQWHRPSFFAAKYMQAHGYRTIPINPGATEILGERSYPSVTAAAEALAAQKARDAGLDSVMDRCVKIEHARLFGGLGWAGVNTKVISSRRPRQLPY